MSSSSKPVLVQALLCDDARKEDNEKQILIGVYARKIIVPSFPATVNLCLWMRMSFPEAKDYRIELLVVDERDAPLLRLTELEVSIADFSEFMDINVAGAIIPFFAPGLLKFHWRMKGEDEWSLALEAEIAERAIA